jgi:leader peptidase (prepilin peptidase)/N-methyltransferase
MATPLALPLSPLLWMVLAAAVLCALGIAVGRASGRLVRLFGPARPSLAPPPVSGTVPSPVTPGTGQERARAGRDRPAQEGATSGPAGGQGAPDTPSAPASDLDPGQENDGPPAPCCPHCRAELRFVRGLPVVAASSFRRHGACPRCERSVRPHPAVIVTTALLFALVGALTPWHLADWTPFGVLAVLWLVALGVPLSVIDLRVMRLPDALVAPAYPVAALLVAAAVLVPPAGPDPERGAQALGGMVLITVLYWLMWRIRPGGLGFGDVKLSGLTGLYAGWAAGPTGALVAAFWAFAAFSLLGLVLLALRRITRTEPLPLGPFMLAATLATVLTGGPLLPNTP